MGSGIVGKCLFALLLVTTLLTPIFRCSGFHLLEQLKIECLKQFEQLHFDCCQNVGDCVDCLLNNMDLAWSHLSLYLFFFLNEIEAEAFAHSNCMNLMFGIYWFC